MEPEENAPDVKARDAEMENLRRLLAEANERADRNAAAVDMAHR